MANTNTTKNFAAWKEDVAFEVWKHHAGVGGVDKDRMIQIATWLLGLSAAIVGFTFSEAVTSNKIVEPVAATCLSIIGLAISCVSAVITLVYGGYANRNWAKADQIAADYHWDRLDPKDSPFPKSEDPSQRPSRLVAWALRQAEPRVPQKQLAPVFWWFFAMSILSLAVHLLIFVWSVIALSRLSTACS